MIKWRTPVVAIALATVVSAADAATYVCTVENVYSKHPYLPSKIVFSADRMFNHVMVETVEVEGVQTAPEKADVVSRSKRRFRLEWSSASYVLQDGIPNQPLAFGRVPPRQFRYTLSLDRATHAFISRVKDTGYRQTMGEAKGRCLLGD